MTEWSPGAVFNEFRGRRVLVTGASRGIGAAVAAALAGLGARVAIHAHRSRDLADALSRRLNADGGDTTVLVGDFGKPAEVAGVVGAAIDALGGLDILVNNAGTMMGRHPAATITNDALTEVFDLNAKSTVIACREAIPALKAAAGGVIVNTTSISARAGGSAGSSAYSAAKAYVSTYTRSLANELAGDGIRVNAVSPGTILTDFHQRYSTPEKLEATRQRTPMKRLGEAEDCIGAYLFLASNKLSGYVTGQVIEVNGGQLMP